MPHCNRCGAHVTERFVRVFGDDERGVDACWECKRIHEVLSRAAHPDVECERVTGQRISDAGWRDAAAEQRTIVPGDAGKAEGVELDWDRINGAASETEASESQDTQANLAQWGND